MKNSQYPSRYRQTLFKIQANTLKSSGANRHTICVLTSKSVTILGFILVYPYSPQANNGDTDLQCSYEPYGDRFFIFCGFSLLFVSRATLVNLVSVMVDYYINVAFACYNNLSYYVLYPKS